MPSPTPIARAWATFDAVWRAWASFWGLMAIACPLGLVAVQSFSGSGDVVRGLSAPRPDSSVVRAGGELSFVQDMERLEACPGDVVEVFYPAGDRKDVVRPIELVEHRRRAQNILVKVYPDVRIVTTVPPDLTPGRWRFVWSVDSRCPMRHRVDDVASFDIEVQP